MHFMCRLCEHLCTLCGVTGPFYAHFNDENFILFPTFSLKVDDSKDNLISYRPIGRSYISHLDYAEKRHPSTSSARPASAPPTVIPDDSSVSSPSPPPSPAPSAPDNTPPAPLSAKQLHKLHDNPTSLPPVPPSATPSASESRTTFDPLKLHCIFGCRRFKNPNHVIAASQNATLLSSGELPPTLGDFTTINNPPCGKPIKKHRKYLEKVHVDIIYGDGLGLHL
jgi:hypothetical protein